MDGLVCLGALRLSVGSETFIARVGEVTHRSLEIGHLKHHTCMGRCPDLLCAVDLIAKDEQESELLGGVWLCPNPHASGHGRPAREALLLQQRKVLGLLGAVEEVLLRRTVDDVE